MGRHTLQTGEVGVSGTGDTINAGGNKLEYNSEELYHYFGDRRLEDVWEDKASGQLAIKLHSMGYYQILEADETKLEVGTKYDVNTQDYTDTSHTVTLPEIISAVNSTTAVGDYARRGESIEISDVTRSFDSFPLVIQAFPGQTISGGPEVELDETGDYRLTVINDGTNLTWAVFKKVTNDGNAALNVNESVNINTTLPFDIPLFNRNKFTTIKLYTYASEYSASRGQTINWSSSEIILMVSDTDVFTTTYAVNQTAPLVEYSFYIGNDDVVYARLVRGATTNPVAASVSSLAAVRRYTPQRVSVYRRMGLAWQSGGKVGNDLDISWTSRSYTSNDLDIKWSTKYVTKDLEITY